MSQIKKIGEFVFGMLIGIMFSAIIITSIAAVIGG